MDLDVYYEVMFILFECLQFSEVSAMQVFVPARQSAHIQLKTEHGYSWRVLLERRSSGNRIVNLMRQCK